MLVGLPTGAGRHSSDQSGRAMGLRARTGAGRERPTQVCIRKSQRVRCLQNKRTSQKKGAGVRFCPWRECFSSFRVSRRPPFPPKDTKLKLYSFSLGAGVCVYFDGEDPLSPAQHCTPGGGGGAWNLKRKRRRSVHRHERLLWLAIRVCAFLLTTPVTLSDCD